MKNSTTIQCPNCDTSIDVNNILTQQISEDLRKEYESKLKTTAEEYSKRESAFAKEKSDFILQKEKQEEIFASKLSEAKKASEKELQIKIKAQLETEQNEKFAELQKELSEKSLKVIEFSKLESKFAKLEREKLELKDTLEAEAEKSFNEKILVERERIQKLEKDKSELREKELLKQIEDQKKLTEEMKRKQEQGSMQLQGEVLELAIEEYLASHFPLDMIDEIKKGANGADCLQIINTREHQNCGTIYYESKRTKSFQPAWIEKFKNDIRDKKANIGVLVTEVLPIGMERMGLMEGIWICTFDEFKGLCNVLRQSIIQLNQAVETQENKGDKMEMLYGFLTSNEFRLQIEGIVEGFSQMQSDLIKEKNSMQRIWKQREKQIDKVVNNTINMYGSIRGIAGNAVQPVKLLEIDSEIELLEESI